jgi:hypothetical protein
MNDNSTPPASRKSDWIPALLLTPMLAAETYIVGHYGTTPLRACVLFVAAFVIMAIATQFIRSRMPLR